MPEECGMACPLCNNPDEGYCERPDKHDKNRDDSPHVCAYCCQAWGWWR